LNEHAGKTISIKNMKQFITVGRAPNLILLRTSELRLVDIDAANQRIIFRARAASGVTDYSIAESYLSEETEAFDKRVWSVQTQLVVL